MSRWSAKEEEALAEVKRRLKDQLTNRPQFPEVVGDRRLIRFLRGKSLNIDESTKMISSFLNWRDAYKVDDIRQDIVYGGKDTPYKFPFGKIIIDLAPQIIISSLSIDKKGRPLAMEMFDFSPKDVLEAISIQDYLVFLTYSLEYRAIVMEQMSHEREQEYLKEYPNPADRREGYGVVLLDYTIRDLKGVGLAHLSAKGRALVGAALELGLPNYQEYLGKCVMINTPWVFNTFWYFVKGFLDAETIAKINFVGSNYMPVLLEDMELQCIPERLGGQFTQYNEAYVFDTSIGGPLYCQEAAATAVAVEVGECDSSISDLSDTCWRNVSTPTCSTKGNSSSDALTTEGLHSNSHKAATTTTTGIAAELGIANIDTSSSLSYSPLSSASTTPTTYTEDQGPAEHSLNNKSKQTPRGAAALAGQASHPSGPSRTAASMLFRRIPSSTTNSNTDTSSRQNRDKECDKGKTPPRGSGSGSTTFNTTAEKEEENNIMNTTSSSSDVTATTKLSSPIVTTTATTATGRNPTRRGSQLVPTPEAATAAAATIAANTYNTELNTYNNNTTSTTTSTTTTTTPSTQKNPIYSLIHAIFTEFSECFYSLYHVLTHYPLKTLLTTTIIAWCLYMRIQGYLHLMVFPVLLLFSIVYFELLR